MEEEYCNCPQPTGCETCDSGLCHYCGGILEGDHEKVNKKSKLYWEHEK